MKNYKLLLSLVAVGASLLFNVAAKADEGTRDGVVTVVGIRGHGDYSIDGGHAWIPLVVGKELPAGSMLRSEALSLVDVLIGKPFDYKVTKDLLSRDPKAPARNLIPQGEKNIIRLRPNTIIGIDKLTVPGSDATVISDCQLDLKKGKILASVRKVSPSSEYLIKIPNGVAAVRGTQFEISTDGTSGGTSCGVVSGTVWLSFVITDANGNPVLGPNGQPLAPIQITLTPGQSFGLTGALLQSLIQDVSSAPSDVTEAALAATLVAAANSDIASITPDELSTLQTVLETLVTPTIESISVTLTVDNGQPPFVSP